METVARETAARMGRNLFRVDLQEVTSKYIGETEKNLVRIFERAAEMNAILYFDEADDLFVSRTGIADSHDRNKGDSVGYLLQLLEGRRVLVVALFNSIVEAGRHRARWRHIVIRVPHG